MKIIEVVEQEEAGNPGFGAGDYTAQNIKKLMVRHNDFSALRATEPKYPRDSDTTVPLASLGDQNATNPNTSYRNGSFVVQAMTSGGSSAVGATEDRLDCGNHRLHGKRHETASDKTKAKRSYHDRVDGGSRHPGRHRGCRRTEL